MPALGVRAPGWLLGLLAAAVLGAATLRVGRGRGDLTRWAHGLAAGLAGAFLLAPQAFCNYYHLVAGCVLLHLALLSAPPRRCA